MDTLVTRHRHPSFLPRLRDIIAPRFISLIEPPEAADPSKPGMKDVIHCPLRNRQLNMVEPSQSLPLMPRRPSQFELLL